MYEVKALDNVWHIWHFVGSYTTSFGAAMKAQNYARRTGLKTKVVSTKKQTRIS